MNSSRAPSASCALLLALAGLAACAGNPARPVPDAATLAEARRAFVDENNAAYAADIDKMLARMESEIRAADDPSDVTYDVLIVHGGGPSGAFTAGFLLGWGELDDPALRRPQFDMVTGSSSGALVAPFAYLGSADAYTALEQLTLEPPFRFRAPSIWSMWPGRSGMTDTRSFRAGLDEVFDDDFLASIAAASREHRALLISGSNVELGLGRFWDVGRQIESGGADAPARVRDIILASTSMPVMFPPVEIDGQLYVDGGVTANIFIGFDAAGLKDVAARWRERHPGVPMPLVRVWVLMSRELFLEPQGVEQRYADIGRRSLTIMMEYDRLKSLAALIYMLRELDDEPAIRTELRYAMPPADSNLPVEVTAIHDRDAVSRLLELGRSLGSSADSWVDDVPETFILRQQ